MIVYRDTALNRKTGQREPASKWTVQFYFRGERRRLVAFADKTASEQLGRKLERLAALRTAGEPPTPELAEWLSHLSPKVRSHLEKIGVLDSRRVAAAKPLLRAKSDAGGEPALLDEFEASLLDGGVTQRHASQTAGRVRNVLAGCGFRFWHDIEALAVERYLGKLRTKRKDAPGISAATSNYLLQATRQFCGWMVRNGRAIEDPLRVLRPLNARVDVRVVRRVLTAEELRSLIAAAANGPVLEGLSGPVRAALYLLAAETGLRRAELMSLRRSSFDFDAKQPTVRLQAAYSKRRREDVLPLRPDTARALAQLLPRGTPSAVAFPVPTNWDAATMVRTDALAARIIKAASPNADELPVAASPKTSAVSGHGPEAARSPAPAPRDSGEDEADGPKFDFHCLRHTFITNLARGGVAPKVAQKLARHSTITLTLDRYTHLRSEDEVRALEALPDLSESVAQAQLAGTGTDGFPAELRPECPGSCPDTPPSAPVPAGPPQAASRAQEGG